MLYSKNGSIPKDHMSGDKEGWVEVSDPPVAPEGKEVVWWYPPGWVVRPLKPASNEGKEWNWSQSEQKWVEHTLPSVIDLSDQSSTSSSDDVDLSMPSASPL